MQKRLWSQSKCKYSETAQRATTAALLTMLLLLPGLSSFNTGDSDKHGVLWF